MNYFEEKKKAVKKFAQITANHGYITGISETGTYGYFSNKEYVVSFQIDYFFFSFSSNHKPSKENGSGIRISTSEEYLFWEVEKWATKDFFQKMINSGMLGQTPTTLEEYLKSYQESSKFTTIEPQN